MNAVEAATTMVPIIAARADEIENARRLPADLAQAMAKAGLFRLVVPRCYGGAQVCVRDLVGAIEVVSAADASAGWCMMIAATTGLNAAYLPQQHAREVYGDPLGITGGVFAPLGQAVLADDTLTVSGRWAWASGSQNCNWLLGGCVIIENGVMRTLPNGAPDHRMVFFPAAEAELIDTWHVTGLKGTGSLDMHVAGVRAPVSRSVSLSEDRPQVEGPLYSFPPFGLLALGIAGVALGNARGAMDAFKAVAITKKPQGAKRSIAERATTQTEYAKSEAALSAARAFLFDAIDSAWRKAEEGGEIPLEIRARLRLAATHAARTGAEVARAMYDLGGGSAVYLDSPLQRRFRDAHVATQHIMVQPAIYELAGRALFDLPLDASTL